MPSQDILNFTLAVFFAGLVVGLLFVLHKLYYTLDELRAVLKKTKPLLDNSNDAVADIKDITAQGKDMVSDVHKNIIGPIAGGLLGDLIHGLINRVTKSKGRRKRG